jgi:hypothetical protein
VNNTAASPATTLNWTTTQPASISLSATSGALGAASGTAITGTITAANTWMGPWSVPGVSFSGADASAGTSAIGSPVSTGPFSINVIGHGGVALTTPGAPGGPYQDATSTQGASLSSGYNLAGLTATLGNSTTSYGIGSTTASILAGSLGASSTGITISWRARATAELPANSHAAAGALPLFSDVANLTGITGGASSPYVLQMSYDPSEVGSTAYLEQAVSNGLLYLGYRSTSGATNGQWLNATALAADGNTSLGPNAVQNYQGTAGGFPAGSYASFTAGAGNGFSLSQTLGAWGVDTADHVAWAVVDHDAEFAVVPEPGTLALLAGGAVALAVAYRRRKMAKA